MVSVSAVNAGDKKVYTVRQKTLKGGKTGLVIGAVAGAIEGFTRKSWLDGKAPADSFVKNVSKGLEKTLTPEENKELTKVKNFFSALVDYNTDVYKLKENVEASKELSGAILKNEGETAQMAIDRVFANTNKAELKKELLEIQNRTQIDKKVNINTAKNITKENINLTSKTLQKSEGTSTEVFNVIKKAAQKSKVNTAIKHTAIGAVLFGIAGLLVGAYTKANQKK